MTSMWVAYWRCWCRCDHDGVRDLLVIEAMNKKYGHELLEEGSY